MAGPVAHEPTRGLLQANKKPAQGASGAPSEDYLSSKPGMSTWNYKAQGVCLKAATETLITHWIRTVADVALAKDKATLPTSTAGTRSVVILLKMRGVHLESTSTSPRVILHIRWALIPRVAA